MLSAGWPSAAARSAIGGWDAGGRLAVCGGVGGRQRVGRGGRGWRLGAKAGAGGECGRGQGGGGAAADGWGRACARCALAAVGGRGLLGLACSLPPSGAPLLR